MTRFPIPFPPEFTAVVSLLGILPDHFLCIYLYVIYTKKHTIWGMFLSLQTSILIFLQLAFLIKNMAGKKYVFEIFLNQYLEIYFIVFNCDILNILWGFTVLFSHQWTVGLLLIFHCYTQCSVNSLVYGSVGRREYFVRIMRI